MGLARLQACIFHIYLPFSTIFPLFRCLALRRLPIRSDDLRNSFALISHQFRIVLPTRIIPKHRKLIATQILPPIPLVPSISLSFRSFNFALPVATVLNLFWLVSLSFTDLHYFISPFAACSTITSLFIAILLIFASFRFGLVLDCSRHLPNMFPYISEPFDPLCMVQTVLLSMFPCFRFFIMIISSLDFCLPTIALILCRTLKYFS